ncbi:MAG: glycosyltransferase [Lachnospiraceae bacterium]|nr:glycosyltransferase [Lachnospiraceae bacterium]
MKISVIIPVYNTNHDYLRACLDSLLSQDFGDFEVVAVNDGSTNGCENIIKEYTGSHDNLVYINQENAGTSVARNTGISNARGEYILFVDADDFLSPGCLGTIYDAMRTRSVDILLFGYATNYTNREMRRVLDNPDPGLWNKNDLELAVLKGDKRLGPVEVGTPWGKLIRHDVIKENDLKYTPGLIKGQDTVFVLSLLEHCESFSYLPYLGYHYRISGSSVSRRYNPGIVSIMEKTLSAYREFTEKYEKGAVFREAVEKKYINVLMGEYTELLYLHPDAEMPYAERIKEYRDLTSREPYRSIIKNTPPKGNGFIIDMEIKCLKRGAIRTFFTIKRMEQILKDMIIHKYG